MCTEFDRIALSYAPACIKLLAQYKSLLKLLQNQLDRPYHQPNGEKLVGLEGFMRRYRMDCPAALHRLVVGVPATVEHSAEAGAGEGEEIGKWVAETTQVGLHRKHSRSILVVLFLTTFTFVRVES
jgi:ESCRT-I complex subunit VPS28